MVYALLKCKVKRHAASVISFRSSKKKELKDELSTLVLDDTKPVHDQYSEWYSIVKKILDTHMPCKKIRVRQKDVAYMNSERKEAIGKKRKYC